ncbi:MAG TPA: BTAD domain-containing putative transcriptional regulator [Streptosporangiaceae bacterium]|nr:BTAD domain-containing putative transcriptional regulator [Streptosporangiaceae bacterium]
MPGRDTLRIRDLGPVDVAEDGQVRAPGGPILGRLLARLLVDPGRRVDVSALVDAVWGDRGATRSLSTLDSHLHRLRRFLAPDRGHGDAEPLILEAGGYRLAVTGGQVDSVQFAQLVTGAGELLAAGQPGQALTAAQEARALWRDRPLSPWSDEPWAAAAVARLEELSRQLTEILVDALLADSRPAQALVELEPVLAAEPLRDRPWEQYMLAAARAGRIEDALSAYRRADRLFRDELGVEPGPELRRLQQLVLSGQAGPPGRPPSPLPPEHAAPAEPPVPAEVHLPRRRTRLIGRGAEVADLTGRLQAASLVTIVGAGGCGKTTLAVATAQKVAGDFPDGVWFVDLSSVQDADDVSAAVVSTLGLAGDGLSDAAGTLRAFTRSRRMLLILDNCEHVLDPVAELTESLLAAGSSLEVLATSREPLESEGEELIELAPLPVGGADTSPAVELFLARLADAAPDRRLNRDDLAMATTICAAVDGVPLAIELAAARSRAFSLPEIAEQVRADPSALSRVGRGRGGRQTVRAAVDRSVRLLAPDERNLHTALSVVPGPVTARMAAALIDGSPGDTESLIAGLVHRSLLVMEGPLGPGRPSRFAQLAIVRGHGAHALGEAGEQLTADRRDQLLVDTVIARPRMGLAGEAEFHDRMDDDLAGLRATLRRTLIDRPGPGGLTLAAGLGMYWYYRGMMIEGSRWIGLALAHLDQARPVDAAILHSAVIGLSVMLGDVTGTRPHLDAMAAAADRATGHDLLLIGDEFAGLTAPAFGVAGPDLLGELARRAAEIAERTGDGHSALLARIAAHRAHPADAGTALAEATALHADALGSGNRLAGWMSASDAVRACVAADDVDGALEWSRRGMEDYLALGARDSPRLVELYGGLHARRGDYLAAVRYLAAAREQYRRAATRWPGRPQTPAILEEAARRLGAAAYEEAWRAGGHLRLADIAGQQVVTRLLPGLEYLNAFIGSAVRNE